MTIRGYQLAVDWSGAGTYTGTLEDVSEYLSGAGPLQVGYGRGEGSQRAPMAAGKTSFALINQSRVFSPENTASPLYGDVEPGRRVRLRFNGTTLFEGVLEDVAVESDTAGKLFRAECLDAWGRPGAERLSTPLYCGVRTGTAIGLVLDAIGWTGGRDLDVGATYIPWWWEEGTDAATAVQNLLDSEGPPSIAYVEGGTFVFRDRHHRILRAESRTVQATFAAAKPAGSRPGALKILRGAQYDRGLQDVVNYAELSVDTRAPGDFGTVWSTEETILLSDGETYVVNAQASDPFFGAEVPAADVDYTILSGTVVVTLLRDSGQSVTVLVQATGGPAVVSGMAVRAYPVAVTSTRKITAEDATSISSRGRRTWDRTAPWASVYDAQVIVQSVVTRFASPSPRITFTIAGVDAAHAAQITARRISDRVRVALDEIGVDLEMHIERVEHEITKLGAVHRLTLACQAAGPEQPDSVFAFDTAGAGFGDGVFGYAGIDEASTMFRFDTAGQGFDDGVFAH